MAINKVNTIAEAKSFKFLENQSTILCTDSTNTVTYNGVNTIVCKPKVGDIMCVTRYKDEGGALLNADEQEVIWIDGLSIVPKQLSTELEPVGICVAINGKKAIVRYKEEFNGIRWSASERWEIPYVSFMNDGVGHSLLITLNGTQNTDYPFTFTAASPDDNFARLNFVNQLNAWFDEHDTNYSAELVELNTDKPANDKSDTKDGNSYRNRIIVNAKFISGFNNFGIEGITPTRAIGKHVKAVNFYYNNNGFQSNYYNGCCREKYYDYTQKSKNAPTRKVTNINSIPGGLIGGIFPVCLEVFADDTNTNCQLLRNTFSTYDEYFDSLMIKCPCSAGGTIAEFQCGKENTYKLADCTFRDRSTGEDEILYLAANKAASINVRGPKLTNGNWWLPSSAEMVQMMYGITFGVDNNNNIDNNTDIVNRVIDKMRSVDTKWAFLSASTYRWTSSRSDERSAYYYRGGDGSLCNYNFYSGIIVSPITILNIC